VCWDEKGNRVVDLGDELNEGRDVMVGIRMGWDWV
jgi:hypothetical protein